MSNWEIFMGDESEWDSLVNLFDGDYRQLWQWGEYKKSVNWKVVRYIKNNNINKSNTEIMQITFKQMWPLCFIYIPGGICNESRTGFSEDVEKLFYKQFRYFLSIIRIDSHYSQSKSLSEKLIKNGWYVPLYRNNVGLASIIQINQLEGINKFTNASTKWKYNYRRGLKNNLILNTNEKLSLIKNEITKVANEMIEYKNVYHIINPSAILDIANYFRQKLVIVTCRNSQNKIIAFRAALCVNNFAWDLFAASNEEGRKLKAGYLLLSLLIEECRSKGANKYSLAGITPGTARSVFKIEAGGSLYPFMGEYEKSKMLFLGKIFNFFLYLTKFSLSYRVISFFLRIIKSKEK